VVDNEEEIVAGRSDVAFGRSCRMYFAGGRSGNRAADVPLVVVEAVGDRPGAHENDFCYRAW